MSIEKILVGGGLICTLVGGITLWADRKEQKAAIDPSSKYSKDLKDNVYLVTGANTGIGKAITRALASRKAKVYMLCRDIVKCEEARKEIVIETQNKYVYCKECDLASQKSIRDFVDAFKKKESRIDALINNAGIYHAPRSVSMDGIEIHFAVNHLGHFLLTSLLTDIIKSSGPGSRIVFLMNLDYRKGNVVLEDLNFQQRVYNKSDAFYQSQLANMLLVKELARRLSGSGVMVNAAYPGIVNTGIKRHMGVDKSISGNIISKPLLWLLPGVSRKPEDGARSPLFLVLDNETITVAKSASGQLFDSNRSLMEIDSVASDDTLAKKLFLVDEYWTGLKSKEELFGNTHD